MSLYWLRNPISDIGGTVATHQNHSLCADFEMRFIDCMEAYGLGKGSKKCIDYRHDLDECGMRTKQFARIDAMRAERQRQIKAGTATYAEPPVQHVYKDYTFYIL